MAAPEPPMTLILAAGMVFLPPSVGGCISLIEMRKWRGVKEFIAFIAPMGCQIHKNMG
jgi:hypothetical protein